MVECTKETFPSISSADKANLLGMMVLSMKESGRTDNFCKVKSPITMVLHIQEKFLKVSSKMEKEL